MSKSYAVLILVATCFGGSAAFADSDRLIEQLTQFNGGCPPNDDCDNAQFSIHRAPVCPNGPDASVTGTFSVSMVRQVDAASPPLRGGSSTLVRASDGVAINLSTAGLRPNAPYTIWWVAFNPDNPCISNAVDCNCGGGDLRPGQDSVLYAGGAMSDLLGNAHFAAHIDYGQVPSGEGQVTPMNAPIESGAEIHLVIRGHGEALKGNGGASASNN